MQFSRPLIVAPIADPHQVALFVSGQGLELADIRRLMPDPNPMSPTVTSINLGD